MEKFRSTRRPISPLFSAWNCVAATFPADLTIRLIAAVRAVPKYFLDSSLYAPVQVKSAVIRGLYSLRASVLSRLAPVGAFAVAAAIVAVAAVNVRAAALALLVMVGFAGAAFLQFHERHFYYLQFVPWLAFGVLIVFLVMVGTIWIMAHMNANMMPSAEMMNLQMQH